MEINVRIATEDDVEVVHSLIYKLAEYEHLSDQCTISMTDLYDLMFIDNSLRAVVTECNGVPVGMATFYFFKVATFSGKKVLYIEDLYINEDYRGKGVGTSIFAKLRMTAKEMNCSRMEWKCLDWNADSIAFYDKMGGKTYDGWSTFILDEANF